MLKIVVRLLTVLNAFLCVQIYSNAQSTNPLPSTSISVPTLDNTGSISANYYTGQPVINFPLFDYKDNYMDHSVILSYNGVGTLAGSLAPAVGLGWNLDVGGYVRRRIQGMPDEFTYVASGVTKLAGYLNNGTISTSPTRAELDEIYDGKRDGEVDEYTFSIPGYSGQIIIDKNNLVVATIPSSDLVITFDRQPNNGRIYKFLIRTPAGVIYTFAAEEIQEFKTKISDVEYSGNYTTGWLLTRVEPFSTGSSVPHIDIEYNAYTSDEVVGYQYLQGGISDPIVITAMGSACVFAHTCCVKSWSYKGEELKMKGTLQRIGSIRFPGGAFLKFGYSNNRCDMANGKALISIDYFSAVSRLEKTIRFDYSYGSTAGEVLPENCSGIDLNKRLLLKKIKEIGKYGEVLPSTNMIYEMAVILPDRNTNSKRIDVWGFADSIQNVDQAKAYTLKQIQYPSGAYAEYEFEPNMIGWTRSGGLVNQTIGGLRIKKITLNEGLGGIAADNAKVERVYSYDLDGTNSSGQVDYLPITEINTRININKIGGCSIIGSQYDNTSYRANISHSPINPFPVGNACGYSKVTEEIRSGNQYLGKTVYYFKNFSDYSSDPAFASVIGSQDFPYAAKQYNISWGLGLLRQVEVYTNTDNIIKKLNIFIIQPQHG